MDPLQLPRTIEDDDDIEIEESDSEEDETMVGSSKGSRNRSIFVEDFEFSASGVGSGGGWNSWDVHEEVLQMAGRRQRPLMTSVDVKIARAREMKRLKAEEEREENDPTYDSDVASSEDSSDDGEAGESGGGYIEDDAELLSGDEPEITIKKRLIDVKSAKTKQTRKLKVGRETQKNDATLDSAENSDTSESVDAGEACVGGRGRYSEDDAESVSGDEPEDTVKIRKTKKPSSSYFEEAPPPQETDVDFTDMNLSRPLLKAVTSLGFVNPTPIQARCVPIALMGKDVCACAATGTGKTAAFMLPILERLLYRPTHTRVSRVLILTPTRELAIQIHSVGKALAKHTSVEFCLASGGLDSKGQEAMLRKSPDIIIATPGRLVDHLHNAPSFSLSTIEILVLDEADRTNT